MKILIVEDELELAKDIISFLQEEKYVCASVANYDAAIEKLLIYEYDCILLDLMIPGGDGLAILKFLKQQNKNAGVIIISAKNALDDKILGLQLGADDYLAKPFHLAELSARILSVVRRKQFDSKTEIHCNELTIELNARKVFVNNNEVVLTKKEFDLVLFLYGNKNRVLSKNTLAEHLSGDFADMFDNHDFVYAHIKNLKRKLKENGCGDYLKTIYGTGYKWEM